MDPPNLNYYCYNCRIDVPSPKCNTCEGVAILKDKSAYEEILRTMDEQGKLPKVPSEKAVEELRDVPILEDEVCEICKEMIRTQHMAKQMPCGHRFHPFCLRVWLKNDHICPYPSCNHELPLASLFQRYELHRQQFE